MNANQRVVLRPTAERFDMSPEESSAFWRMILPEYTQRAIRDQSIQLLDNNPIRSIFEGEEKS